MLSQTDGTYGSAPSNPQSLGDLEKIRRALADGATIDDVGRSVTLELAAYLNRPVRCSALMQAPPMAHAWRFEARGQGFAWWLDLDPDLAAAFADAMIGGQGTSRLGHGRRVRALVERVALRFLRTIATAVHVEQPREVRAVDSLAEPGAALAGGLCAVATDQFPWQVGVRANADVAPPSRETPAQRATSAPSETPTPLLSAGIAKVPPEAPAAARELLNVTGDDAIRAAIDAFRSRIEEVLHCRVAAEAPEISHLPGSDLVELPQAPLRLALTAGGKGALVMFLSSEAVTSLASGAVSISLPPDEQPGDVALAAAEAIVRDALANASLMLPGIRADGHRIVRLSDSPLPARTPHHTVDLRLSVGGRVGMLQLLVPSWMLSREAMQ